MMKYDPKSDMLTFQKAIHQTAVDKGWWESERNFGEMLALIHSEISESLEEWRGGFAPTYRVQSKEMPLKPEGFISELGDAVIRILDVAEHYGIDLGEVIAAKMEYNDARPYRHGGKKA